MTSGFVGHGPPSWPETAKGLIDSILRITSDAFTAVELPLSSSHPNRVLKYPASCPMDVVGQQRTMARGGAGSGINKLDDGTEGGGSGETSGASASASRRSDESAASHQTTPNHRAVIASPRPATGFFRRRRSRSVDETMLVSHRSRPYRARPHRLLEDHYRVDRITNNPRKLVVLPGVPKHEEDWARDSHDFFNLIVLIPVVVLNVMNWNWEAIFEGLQLQQADPPGNHHRSKHKPPSSLNLPAAWTGEWFDWFFGVTLLYFCIDLIWILLVPSCVKSPSTIVQHHLATILYILIPYHRPAYQWCMGACMIVEVNTWFLIARRVFNKQGFPPWILNLSFVSIRVKLISILFYVTWIGIRCILYPYLLVEFTRAWMHHSEQVGTKWNLIGLSVPLHAAFCLLNVRWTYDLLMSKVRYWRRKGSHKAGAHVDKGL